MQLIYFVLLFALLWSSAIADIIYSVIVNSPNSDTGVVLNGNVYPLQVSKESTILFQGKAPSDTPYRYAKLEKNSTKIIEQEDFIRSASKNNTLNEFYGRNWNKKSMVTFNNVAGITKNFDRQPDNELLHPTGEIPTIHVIANQAEIDNMHKNFLEDITVMATVTHISTTSAKTFSDVKFEIGGRSSRRFTKLAYNIKLPKKTELGGYRKLKLRTTVSDPSYMREYLATEMIYAANQPCSRASYVRLFLNDKPIGLFSLLEKYDDLWLQNEFNEDPKSNGVLYEGEGGQKDENRADLSYKGDDVNAYTNTAYSISEDPAVGTKNDYSDLIKFTKFINDQLEFQKSNNASAIADTTALWEKELDVEGFLVAMAFDFLQGSWDAYLQNTNNYFLYKSPKQNRFIYISWDFDYVMGSGPVNMKAIIVGDYNSYGGVKLRPLMVALMNVPTYRSLFEKHLSSIISTLYEPSKSFPVIDSVYNLIKDDVAWDKSLPRVRKGLEFLSLDTILNAGIGGNAGKPLCISYLNAVQFITRVNSKISHKKAIEGKTGHSSLYAIKPWINEKLDNIARKTTYKLPLLPLK